MVWIYLNLQIEQIYMISVHYVTLVILVCIRSSLEIPKYLVNPLRVRRTWGTITIPK